MLMDRDAGNYHVIQGGTWKVAKWEPSRIASPISGHWYVAGYRRSFLDGELDQIGPRILPPDLEDRLPAKDAGSCAHERFSASVSVGRLQRDEGGPITGYTSDITVLCEECSFPFAFIGVAAGNHPSEPRVSIDGTELRAPL